MAHYGSVDAVRRRLRSFFALGTAGLWGGDSTVDQDARIVGYLEDATQEITARLAGRLRITDPGPCGITLCAVLIACYQIIMDEFTGKAPVPGDGQAVNAWREQARAYPPDPSSCPTTKWWRLRHRARQVTRGLPHLRRHRAKSGVAVVVAFSVTIDSSQLQAMLDAVQDCAQDMSVPLRRSSQVIRNDIAQIFEDEGPPGAPWKPLTRAALLARLGRSRTSYRSLLDKLFEQRSHILNAERAGASRESVRQLYRQRDRTAARKRKMEEQWLAGPHKILQDTGRLRRSITASSESAPGAVRHLSKTSLFIGTDLEYAGAPEASAFQAVLRRVTERMVKEVAQVFRHWAVERLIRAAKDWGAQ